MSVLKTEQFKTELPMKKLSTRCVNETDRNRKEQAENGPCRQTLAFLTQFARVYHAEPVLRPEFCGLILN